MADASLHPYRDGESLRAVQARAVPAMERLMAGNLGGRIVAVAHNIFNRAYLAHVLGMPLAQLPRGDAKQLRSQLAPWRAGRGESDHDQRAMAPGLMTNDQ